MKLVQLVPLVQTGSSHLGDFDSVLGKHGFIEGHETRLAHSSSSTGLHYVLLPLLLPIKNWHLNTVMISINFQENSNHY